MTELNQEQQFFADLEQITNRGIKPGLESIQTALDLVGNPQKSLKIIHVAGTNGKGSTCQFLAQILSQQGYKVGLFLSPHVESYHERIQIADPDLKYISTNQLVALHQELKSQTWDRVPLTYFEWSVFLALNHFKQESCDFVVLETGLGGRWDATNICDSLVSSIVSVGFDHVEILGDTKEKILNEKLQIIKPNSDFIFGPLESNLIEQAKAHCQSVGARFYHKNQYSSRLDEFLKGQNLPWQGYLAENFRLSLSLAIQLQEHGFEWKTSLDLSKITPPPARFEVLRKEPLLILDGAHNEPALKELKNLLNEKGIKDYNLIFGCLKNRPIMDLIPLIQSTGESGWIQFDAGSLTTPHKTYEQVQKKFGGQILALNEETLQNWLKSNKTLVVCGSFYLCGAMKPLLLRCLNRENP